MSLDASISGQKVVMSENQRSQMEMARSIDYSNGGRQPVISPIVKLQGKAPRLPHLQDQINGGMMQL